jgi:hypothetical protein
MSVDQDCSGDYGYDLAHEVMAGLDASIPRPRSPRPAVFKARPGEVDPHGDLGYDSAHDG